MTTRDLDRLNRRLRVLQAVQRGEKYSDIAAREGIGRSAVSWAALKAGYRCLGTNAWRANCRAAELVADGAD